ncbi:MAG: hypothetical protein NTZ95_02595 [Candidatus Omnitrophica bacterium]|nr:hypothetical protein [Candidatus Omnitrophota bacterium]
MKKIAAIIIVTLFAFSAIGAYAAETALNQPIAKPYDKTKDRMSRAMNNIFYGPTELPDNISNTKTKGEAMDRCIPKTKTGVERDIARLVGGVWQIATFWYSDPGYVTSTVNWKAVVPDSASPAPQN